MGRHWVGSVLGKVENSEWLSLQTQSMGTDELDPSLGWLLFTIHEILDFQGTKELDFVMHHEGDSQNNTFIKSVNFKIVILTQFSLAIYLLAF